MVAPAFQPSPVTSDPSAPNSIPHARLLKKKRYTAASRRLGGGGGGGRAQVLVSVSNHDWKDGRAPVQGHREDLKVQRGRKDDVALDLVDACSFPAPPLLPHVACAMPHGLLGHGQPRAASKPEGDPPSANLFSNSVLPIALAAAHIWRSSSSSRFTVRMMLPSNTSVIWMICENLAPCGRRIRACAHPGGTGSRGGRVSRHPTTTLCTPRDDASAPWPTGTRHP